jgi:hypothetical protein
MKSFFKIFKTFLFLSVVPLVFCSIFQITEMTKEKQLIQETQKEIDLILEESAFSVLSNEMSLDEVEEMARERNFIDISNTDITYIEETPTEVVVK